MRPAPAILLAWPLVSLPALGLAALFAALFPAAPTPQFPGDPGVVFFLVTLFAPIVETLIMAAVLELLLRIVPPAWAIGRTAIAEHRAGEHTITKGSIVVVSPWLLHHDPRWWHDGDTFRPEPGKTLADTVPKVTGIAWAKDNKTLFYVENDPETLLTVRVKQRLTNDDAPVQATVIPFSRARRAPSRASAAADSLTAGVTPVR